MLKLAGSIPVVIMIGISLVSIQNTAFGKLTSIDTMTIELPAKTVIRREQDLVKSHKPRVPKPKLFRSNPLRKSLILEGRDPFDTIDDEDYISQWYRRPDFKKKNTDDEELSEHIRWRLFLARQLAIMKYRKIYNLS